jgi:hypothetical protein
VSAFADGFHSIPRWRSRVSRACRSVPMRIDWLSGMGSPPWEERMFRAYVLAGLIEEGPEVGRVTGNINCQERLGGMLRYYYRQAA